MTKVRWLPQAAAASAARAGGVAASSRRPSRSGSSSTTSAGRSSSGELERAVAWGRRLGVQLVDRLAANVEVDGYGPSADRGPPGTAQVTVVPRPGSE